MYLTVSKESVPDKSFMHFLINYIRVYLIEHIDKDRARAWDRYFLEDSLLSGVTLKQVIGESLKHLAITEFQDRFEISIKTEEKIRGSSAKLYEVCRLINYGNLSMVAYPIFTNTFKYFKNHLSDYIDKYNGVERKSR